MTMMFAVDFTPFLSGVLAVVIGFIVWMGSVYLLLATNLGARLGFLVALTALFGWMALMGAIWWAYGIGYKGAEPSWEAVPGSTVIQEVDKLHEAGVVDAPLGVTAADPAVDQSAAVRDALLSQGWKEVASSATAYGQAVTSASNFLSEEGAFQPGEFEPVAVYEINPPAEAAYPKLGPNGEFDQIAFFHPDYFTVVEVAPVVPVYAEAGRAPVRPEVDDSRQRQYVYMVRNPGNLREPSAYICLSSTAIFLLLCWLLHRRDRLVDENLKKPAVQVA